MCSTVELATGLVRVGTSTAVRNAVNEITTELSPLCATTQRPYAELLRNVRAAQLLFDKMAVPPGSESDPGYLGYRATSLAITRAHDFLYGCPEQFALADAAALKKANERYEAVLQRVRVADDARDEALRREQVEKTRQQEEKARDAATLRQLAQMWQREFRICEKPGNQGRHYINATLDGGQQVRALTLQVDTGADHSMVPQALLDTLPIAPHDVTVITGVTGAARVPVYWVTVHLEFTNNVNEFRDFPLRIQVYGGIERDVGLLGRDVLDRLTWSHVPGTGMCFSLRQ